MMLSMTDFDAPRFAGHRRSPAEASPSAHGAASQPTPVRAPTAIQLRGGIATTSEPTPTRLPTLTPTIAPLGHERLIAVRYVRDGEVVVRGGATGREYHFAPGQARDIPLADARLLVSEGDFAFSGGR
jgi:hypothetical protein